MSEDYCLKNSQEIDKARKSIKISFLEGSCYSVMFGFGEIFLGPFAIALRAINFQLALLSSLPNLIASLIQIKVPELIEKIKKRKTIFVLSGVLQAIIWLPMLLLPFIIHKGIVWILILLAILYSASFGIGISAWGSTIAELVPERIRGKIFGKRNRLLGLVTLISTFLAGGILHLFNNKNIFYGFALIFFIAFIFRITSSFLLNSMHESKLIIKKELSFSFKEFLRRLPFNNFGKFVIFVSLMSLATYSSAPFYSMYMLRDLKLSYFHYTFLITIAAFINLLFMPYWGGKADRYGNIKILKISGFLVPFAAIVWFFSANFYYLIFCMFFSGLAWSGFNLSFNNFIYDSTSPARRARCIAYFNVLNGTGIFLGSMLGSLLARQKIFIFFGSNLPFIFLISGILRLLVSLFLLRGLREIRNLREVKTKDFILDIIGIYPITSFIKKWGQA